MLASSQYKELLPPIGKKHPLTGRLILLHWLLRGRFPHLESSDATRTAQKIFSGVLAPDPALVYHALTSGRLVGAGKPSWSALSRQPLFAPL